MGKVKAKNIQERFGFQDEEIATPTHDKIVCWVADNAEFVAKKFIEKNKKKRVLSCRVEWEPLLKNDRNFEVGFMDLLVHAMVKRYDEDDCKWWESSNSLWIEAKSSIQSLGVLFRQLSMYRDCLKYTGDRKIIVVCPDDTHEERIVGQGYGFVKAFSVGQ
jgi:hypothetical protein